MIKRLTWYMYRLSSMSTGEIIHRISEQVKKTISSFFVPDFGSIANSELDLPELPGLADGISQFVKEGALLHEWCELADDAREGRINLLGIEWPPHSASNKWVIDPQSGKLWPNDSYCFRIPYRYSPEMGDVKYVWELNRLQYLQPLAALCVLRSDDELRKYCINELENWIDSNPPFCGVGWASGIELSCRLVSILFVTTLIDSHTFTPALRHKIRATLAAHGYWLFRYPSRFSSANNHLVAEATGLFLLGTLCPWLPQSRQWAEYGKKTLIEEAGKQIHGDGVGAEQSPTYLAFTLEWFLISAKVAKAKGISLPEQFWKQIGLAGEYLCWVTDSSGNQPRIGDDDEGRVVYFKGDSGSYVCSAMAGIASLLGRNDLSPPVVRPTLLHTLFGVASISKQELSGPRCFSRGGYTVFRGTIDETKYMLIMDHGPLGYLSIAAHGHADALSLWLNIDGMPVIVDAGTYLYHAGREWRDHMRSTPAHNTLSICGESSSKISGPFNWSDKANSSLIHFEAEHDQMHIEAEHDGFLSKYGVHHRRALHVQNDGAIVIKDRLIGAKRGLSIEIGFLLHPNMVVENRDDLWIVVDEHGRQLLEFESCSPALIGNVQFGQKQPLRGWYSAAFSHIVPTSRLVFKGVLVPHSESVIKISIAAYNTNKQYVV